MLQTIKFAMLSGSLLLIAGPAQTLPTQVEAAAEEYLNICIEVLGDVQPTDQYVSALDITGNGKLDYVIDTHALGCSAHCGSAGCTIELWGANEHGAGLVHRTTAYSWSVSQQDGQRQFILDVHGSWCDRAGVDPCQTILRYQEGWTEETR